MSAGKIFGGIAIFMVALLLLGGCSVYRGYNRAVELDEQVRSRWAQVENQLQRRYDLIPNLVETVKGIAGQEKEVFLGIAESREAYFQAQQSGSVAEKAEAAEGVERALSRLLLLREMYPQLRSNENFLALQDQLEGTENRIAVERKRYNDAVQELNTFRRKLLGRFYASLAGVEEAEYFETEAAAQEVPQVDFSNGNQKGNQNGKADQPAPKEAEESL